MVAPAAACLERPAVLGVVVGVTVWRSTKDVLVCLLVRESMLTMSVSSCAVKGLPVATSGARRLC